MQDLIFLILSLKKKKNDAVELGGTEKVKKEPRFNI